MTLSVDDLEDVYIDHCQDADLASLTLISVSPAVIIEW